MVVRPGAIRPIVGFGKFFTKTTLASLALAGSLTVPAPLSQAAESGSWSSGTPRSVLVQSTGSSNGRRIPTPFVSRQAVPDPGQGIAVEEIAPGNSTNEPFDGGMADEGVVVGSPHEGYHDSGASVDGSYPAGEGGYQGGFERREFDGQVFDGQEPGQLPCGTPGCQGHCTACQHGSRGLPEWRYNADCEPMGLLQKMYLLNRGWKSDGGWTGRVDALILSRNAPGFRPLYTFAAAPTTNALNANQLESIAAVGPRVSLFHRDPCGDSCGDHCGHGSWESTYIYSGAFVAQRTLAPAPAGYVLAPPGIYSNPGNPDGVDAASARLTSALQTAEFNRRWCLGPCSQFLAGFRWIQWQENLSISDIAGVGTAQTSQDSFATGTYNNLFGGQIGLDTALWQPSKHFRLEGLVKAGAYYNAAYQSSSYQNYVNGGFNNGASVSAGSSPATCSFAGELGLTGVIPICCNVDFRLGYFGLWLSSIAQPSNQLSGQVLVPNQSPVTYGSLATNGSVILQGLSLGLEGRW